MQCRSNHTAFIDVRTQGRAETIEQHTMLPLCAGCTTRHGISTAASHKKYSSFMELQLSGSGPYNWLLERSLKQTAATSMAGVSSPYAWHTETANQNLQVLLEWASVLT